MVTKTWSCLYLISVETKKNILQVLDLLWCPDNNVQMYTTIYVQEKKNFRVGRRIDVISR